MAVAVVDVLEVVDVDQHQRARDRRLAAACAQGGLEVTPVGQTGQHVALGQLAQLGVGVRELGIAGAHAAQQQGAQRRQRQADRRTGRPQPLLQLRADELRLLDPTLAVEQGQGALALLVVEALLQLDHCLLLVAPEQLLGQAALLAPLGVGLDEVAGAFEVLADFGVGQNQGVERSGLLVQRHRGAGVAQALVLAAQHDLRQADIGQRDRLRIDVLQPARQRQCVLGMHQRLLVVAAAQVQVGQVGGGQHLVALGADALGMAQRGVRRCLACRGIAVGQQDALGGVHGRQRQVVLGRARQRHCLGLDLQCPVALAGTEQCVGQRAHQIDLLPLRHGQCLAQRDRFLVQAHRVVELPALVLQAGQRVDEVQPQRRRHVGRQAGQRITEQPVGPPDRPLATQALGAHRVGRHPRPGRHPRRRSLGQHAQLLDRAVNARIVGNHGLRRARTEQRLDMQRRVGDQPRQQPGPLRPDPVGPHTTVVLQPHQGRRECRVDHRRERNRSHAGSRGGHPGCQQGAKQHPAGATPRGTPSQTRCRGSNHGGDYR